MYSQNWYHPHQGAGVGSGNEERFGQMDFALGSVRGARTFKLGPDDHLMGLVFQSIWLPGLNNAECRRMGGVDKPFYIPVSKRAITEGETTDLREAPHSIAGCSHGFYAYYDGSNDYHNTGDIHGMIEGYGEVVIGTRGFRAMKAKIVALSFAETIRLADKDRVLATMHTYAGVPIFDTFEMMVSAYPPSKGEDPSILGAQKMILPGERNDE